MLFQLGWIFKLLDPINHFLVDIYSRYEILEAVSKMPLNWTNKKDPEERQCLVRRIDNQILAC